MSKEDIYGVIDEGNAAEIASEAISDLSESSSNTVNGPVQDKRDSEYPEKE